MRNWTTNYGSRKRREPVTESGIKAGCHIVVALTSETITDVDATWGSDPPNIYDPVSSDDGPHERADFRRCYVDKIDENAGILHFTVCRSTKPYLRTGSKGMVAVHDEGKTWASGWSEEAMTILRATFNLSGES